MRPCPKCGKEIQDEAIVCRYCGRDVERPEWLRNKVRCAYCAEWISPHQTLCPYCKSDLMEPAPEPVGTSEAPPETTPPVFDRTEVDEPFKPAFTERPEPTPEFDQAAAPEAPFRAVPRASAQSPYLRDEPLEAAEEPLRAHPIEERRALALPDLGGLANLVSGRNLRMALFALIGIGGVVGIGYLAVRYGGELPAAALAPPTATETTVPTARATRPVTETMEPSQAASPTNEPGACLSWEEISLEDSGEDRCAQGEVKRWFAAGDLPFVAIFTEEAGTFAIVDRNRAHPEVNSGECIRAEGQVEVMSATRPFIDLAGTVLECR